MAVLVPIRIVGLEMVGELAVTPEHHPVAKDRLYCRWLATRRPAQLASSPAGEVSLEAFSCRG